MVSGDCAGRVFKADTAFEEKVEGGDVDSFAFFEDYVLQTKERFVEFIDGGRDGGNKET